jgi:hypothetical protein
VGLDKADTSTTGVGVVISDYDALTTVSFPNLTTVGSNLVLIGNPLVTNVNGFNSLVAVSGNVDITGNFHTLEFPNLAVVNGSFNVQSSAENFTCPDFSNVSVKGSFACAGNVANPQPLIGDNSTTNPTSLANMTTPNATGTPGVTSTSSSTASSNSSPTSSAAEPKTAGMHP